MQITVRKVMPKAGDITSRKVMGINPEAGKNIFSQ